MIRSHFIFLTTIHTHTHIFFIHSSIDRHWCFFYIFTIINNASMNFDIHISFQIIVLFSLDKYPKWIAGPQSNFVFNFLRNLYTILVSRCTNLSSTQQCMRVPFSPHPHQLFTFTFFFFYNSQSDSGEIVLISISLSIFSCAFLNFCNFYCVWDAKYSLWNQPLSWVRNRKESS